MPRILPPLETFRFFEAAARHLNFTHAAEEMHVTHGAVSQRIKRLEEHLGTALFRRRGRGMLLTDGGRGLLESVQTAISEIAEGVEAIRPNNTDRILTISTTPCLAAYWLLPRLADFNEQHPDIHLYVRMLLIEVRKARQQPVRGQTRRRTDRQDAIRIIWPDRLDAFGDFADGGLHALQEPASPVGQQHASAAAPEKSRSQMLFQALDALAHRAVGDVHLLGGVREIQVS